MTKTKKLVTLALLTAVSLVLFIIESQFPPIIPMIPGVKIGLANTVTLYILHKKSYLVLDAFLVVTVRVALAGLVTGSLLSLLYSFSGGIASLVVMLFFRKVMKSKLIPVTSAAGALVHNLMQIVITLFIYGGFGVLLYLPALVLSGLLSGLLTGFVTTLILKRRIP